MTPSHGTLAVRCHAPEDLVGIAAQVVAHRYHRGVHKADAAALDKALKLHEEHHVEEHTGMSSTKRLYETASGK